jgi:hypothetical protein
MLIEYDGGMIADKIGQTGLVKNGPHAGFSIRIEYDAKDTGGYYILIWKVEPREGYDDWVQSQNDLEQFFVESEWIVEWPSDNSQN